MEAQGIISPVTAIESKYKVSTFFDDVITIAVWIEEFKGVKLKLGYEMRNEEGALVFEAKSEHCFLDENRRVVSIRKTCPEFYEVMNQLVGVKGE